MWNGEKGKKEKQKDQIQKKIEGKGPQWQK
jgi:hypothetical protein